MVILLLDANLSWRLVNTLRDHFDKILHVDNIGLSKPATDSDIWSWALKNNATIVTNDEDFYYFSLQKGFPPKVILLRSGNLSTKAVTALMIKHKEVIKKFIKNDTLGLLEIL